MPQKVVLRSHKRQVFHGNLYHGVVCRRALTCFCHQYESRSEAGKRVTVKAPKCFHVFGLSESEALPAEVLYLPEVKDAIRSGWLSVSSSTEGTKGIQDTKKADTQPVALEVQPSKKGKRE